MRLTILIDDVLMQQAQAASGASTKREVVEQGLKALVALNQQKRIRTLRGKLRWEGDLDASRRDA